MDTGFIEAKDGMRYPASRIIAIGAPLTRRGDWVVDVTFAEVGIVECYGWRVEEFLRQPTLVFLGQPETYILHIADDIPYDYRKTLVIAWGVSRDQCLLPITAEGVNDGLDKTHFVLTPDGRVSQAESGSWPDIASWLKSQEPQLDVA